MSTVAVVYEQKFQDAQEESLQEATNTSGLHFKCACQQPALGLAYCCTRLEKDHETFISGNDIT